MDQAETRAEVAILEAKKVAPPADKVRELELELIQSQMSQKPMLRGEVGARAWRV